MILKEKWRFKGIKDISSWTNINFLVITQKKAHKDKDICIINLLSIILTSLKILSIRKRERKEGIEQIS